MKIHKDILKELNSYEVSELQRLLEAMEAQEYYCSGHKFICGGYEVAEAFGIAEDGYYDVDADEDFDAIEIELESGEQDGGRTSCTKVCYKIGRNILGDTKLSLKEKLQKVEEL